MTIRARAAGSWRTGRSRHLQKLLKNIPGHLFLFESPDGTADAQKLLGLLRSHGHFLFMTDTSQDQAIPDEVHP